MHLLSTDSLPGVGTPWHEATVQVPGLLALQEALVLQRVKQQLPADAQLPMALERLSANVSVRDVLKALFLQPLLDELACTSGPVRTHRPPCCHE